MHKPSEKKWMRTGLAAAIAACAGVFACNAVLGVGDFQAGVCNEGDTQCADNTPHVCDAGQWESRSSCDATTCSDGGCIGECVAGDRRCADDSPQTCNEVGKWVHDGGCVAPEICQAGRCIRECGPGDVQCTDAGHAQYCDGGVWQTKDICAATCELGECK